MAAHLFERQAEHVLCGRIQVGDPGCAVSQDECVGKMPEYVRQGRIEGAILQYRIQENPLQHCVCIRARMIRDTRYRPPP